MSDFIEKISELIDESFASASSDFILSSFTLFEASFFLVVKSFVSNCSLSFSKRRFAIVLFASSFISISLLISVSICVIWFRTLFNVNFEVASSSSNLIFEIFNDCKIAAFSVSIFLSSGNLLKISSFDFVFLDKFI